MHKSAVVMLGSATNFVAKALARTRRKFFMVQRNCMKKSAMERPDVVGLIRRVLLREGACGIGLRLRATRPA
jgi:hypothetical protein